MFADRGTILFFLLGCLVMTVGCPGASPTRKNDVTREITVRFRAPWSLRIHRTVVRQGEIWQIVSDRLVAIALARPKNGSCKPVAPGIHEESRHGKEHHCLVRDHVVEKGLWVVGKQEGEWIIQEVKGAPIASVHFLHGRLHGPVRVWHPNGKLWILCHFDRDYRQGSCQWWYANGQTLRSSSYLDDDRHGPEQEWFAGGQRLSSCAYIRDAPEGRCMRWYPNGKPLWERFYRQGKAHGVWWSWFANGRPMTHQMFHNGQPCGVETYWLDDGNVAQRTSHPPCPQK